MGSNTLAKLSAGTQKILCIGGSVVALGGVKVICRQGGKRNGINKGSLSVIFGNFALKGKSRIGKHRLAAVRAVFRGDAKGERLISLDGNIDLLNGFFILYDGRFIKLNTVSVNGKYNAVSRQQRCKDRVRPSP